ALEATGDYIVDEKHKTVTLTESGTAKVEQMLLHRLNGGHIYDLENAHIKHHADQALRAHTLFHLDVDYMVKDGEVVIVDEFTGEHGKGRPVLVGTVSIEKSEKLSTLLDRRGLKRGTATGGDIDKHVVLNAKYHAQEAEIVAQAGRKGAVTIATNMAGRGTD